MKPFFKFSQVVFLHLSTRQLQPSAFYFTQNVLSLKKKKKKQPQSLCTSQSSDETDQQHSD